ncbi:MAG: DUF1080 domain-containing protein [Thermoguttaceae bacterium]
MTCSRPWMFLGLVQIGLALVMFCQPGRQSAAEKPTTADTPQSQAEKSEKATKTPPPKKKSEGDGKSLFDGKTLKGWKTPDFGGQGNVLVKDGAIVMEAGNMMTGVTWTGKPPRNNYELSLEGKRIQGNDFFCTTTFPVGDDPCSLVVGGWGGALVGLSSIDGMDASENATTKYLLFKRNQWYRIRIRVTDAAVDAWIDDEHVVNQSRKGHKFTIRSEVELCRPLGICTWGTTGAVRNVRLGSLEGSAAKAESKK